MTYPHGQAPEPAKAKPTQDPRFAECADCGHFPNAHCEPERRRAWGGSVSACRAWAPNDHRRCRCKSWRGKDGKTLAEAQAAAVAAGAVLL